MSDTNFEDFEDFEEFEQEQDFSDDDYLPFVRPTPQKQEEVDLRHPPAPIPKQSSHMATRRLMTDLMEIQRCPVAKKLFSVTPHPDDFYVWDAKLFGYDESDQPLFGDLKKFCYDAITLEIRFCDQFPSLPPFIRVVSPIFEFRTGHVVLGGGVCHQALSTDNWSPALTVHTLLNDIRINLVIGNARLSSNQDLHQYSLSAATSSYTRAMSVHGWKAKRL
ncbi:hypothetical protein P9112_003083 [Eukaryota sp. TZLM1-RC]